MQLAIGRRSCYRRSDQALEELGLEEESGIEIDFATAAWWSFAAPDSDFAVVAADFAEVVQFDFAGC